MNRRKLLATAAAAITTARSRPAFAALDLDEPEDNLESYIRLRGDTSGRPVYDMVHGRIYGLVQGQGPRPLFRTMGAQVSRYRRVSALEWVAQTRYIGLITDWETNELLEQWKNPYTGQVCQVPITRYGPSEMRLLPDRLALPDDSANCGEGAAIRPWYVTGGIIHIVDQIMPPTPVEKLPDADLITFTGSRASLNDPSLTRVPSRMNFTGIEGWREWMNTSMAGSALWHVNGVKLNGPNDYPAGIATTLLRLDPAFFDQDST